MDNIHRANGTSPAIAIDGNRRLFTELLFVLLLLLITVFSAEIASAVYVAVIAICLFAANWRIKRGYLTLVTPFFILFVFGMLEAHHHPLFDVMKDVWYLAKVFFALGAGYFLMHYLRSLQQMCRLVVVAAVIGAMYHIFQIALHFQSGVSLLDLRQEVGGGYFVTVIGLGLLVGYRQVRQFIGFDRKSYYLAILLCAGSLVISMSRTNIISFALIFLILRGWGKLDLKNFIMLVLVGVMVAVVLLSGAFDSNQDDRWSLIGKFAHSVTEVAASDYADMQDINLNWRGFESYRAYLTYLDGSLFEKAFGQGFGAMVDLGFYMPLGGGGEIPFRYIPILHNGYMYVLVKYGLLGVLIYLYFIFKLIRAGMKEMNQQSVEVILAGRLISSLGWVFLFATIVIAGLFNKSVFDSALIILGATVAWRNMQKIKRGR